MRRMYSKQQLLEAVESESKLNGIKVFEDIKDKDGHKRFIEGDITTNKNVPYTPLFAKWSLSGTHLMIVLFFSVESGNTIPLDTPLGTLEVPKWVLDKLIPFNDNIIERKQFSYYDIYGNPQNAVLSLRKQTNNLIITQYDNLTIASNDKVARIAFDFIIDNN